MTDKERSILSMLRTTHYVRSKQIERMLKMPGIEVRNAVRTLRRLHFPVGASHRGYYLAKSREEWEAAKKDMKRRVVSMATTLREMEEVSFDPDLFERTIP